MIGNVEITHRGGYDPDKPRHANFKGGRFVGTNGYVYVEAPKHPRASSGYRYVREHILIVEKAIGKYLRHSAPVHHIDEIRTNNANDNLVACDSQAYHHLLHQRTRALDACGDANAHRCPECHGYENQNDLVYRERKGRINGVWRHRKCETKRVVAWRRIHGRKRGR